jgi:hypothetical protein
VVHLGGRHARRAVDAARALFESESEAGGEAEGEGESEAGARWSMVEDLVVRGRGASRPGAGVTDR